MKHFIILLEGTEYNT